MIVLMKPGAPLSEAREVMRRLSQSGHDAHVLTAGQNTIVSIASSRLREPELEILSTLPGVERLVASNSPYKLASRNVQPTSTIVKVTDNFRVGGDQIAVIAGPCSVENEEQIVSTARAVRSAGAIALRGGAFKPRSSVYSFQGLGEEGLRLLKQAREETGLPIVTEVIDHEMLDLYFDDIDVIQIGSRSMQNFPLLKAAGESGKPVLLKRGMMATIEEFLMSAEYILAAGNPNVMLCERGIRTFENATRNTLDLSAVPVLKEKTHLPVLVDPSHGTGVARYVASMSKAAVACGADGLLIEVHIDPTRAVSDGAQTLAPKDFETLMVELELVAQSVGRSLRPVADGATQCELQEQALTATSW
ncbi:MAG: 3-deoxy-7-phosphoheptulonate synthase [Deltaproteobacteria bacterium]|nr:3-deoxy-7-phosphoheptulonate synthase [Deltaproteobacteria bacterium]